jgi:hypothetical protein
MRTRAALAWLLVFGASGAIAAQTSMTTLSLRGYIDRLDALASAVETSTDEPSPALAALVDDVPAIWHVETPRQTFDIPTAWLTRDISAWREGRDNAGRAGMAGAASARLVNRLHALGSEAALFERPVEDPARSRGALTDILNGREFRSLHGPTWTDRLRQWVFQFMADLLGRLFGLSAIPTIGNILVYGLIALAVAMLAVRTYLFIRRDATVHTIRPDQQPASATPWSDWLADAQTAAASRQWREAVHAAYWCAVSFLETRGAWKPDRARTPREYLRLLPDSSEHRSTLVPLTRRFERVWYGTEQADAEAFDEVIASLKKMGCLS